MPCWRNIWRVKSYTADEIKRGLREVVSKGSYIPVFVAAGSAEIGLAPLLDAMVDLMPSPAQVPPVVANGKDGEEQLTVQSILAHWLPMCGKRPLIHMLERSAILEYIPVPWLLIRGCGIRVRALKNALGRST